MNQVVGRPWETFYEYWPEYYPDFDEAHPDYRCLGGPVDMSPWKDVTAILDHVPVKPTDRVETANVLARVHRFNVRRINQALQSYLDHQQMVVPSPDREFPGLGFPSLSTSKPISA